MEVNRLKQDAQAKKFLTLAKKYGVEKNFLFATTFERYLVQLQMLADLKKVIDNEGNLITKQYVKGRENIYTHPALSEYIKISDSSNKTANILMNIVLKMKSDDKTEKNSIDKFLNEFKKDKKQKNKKAEESDDLS